jgi:hypothetical protein
MNTTSESHTSRQSRQSKCMDFHPNAEKNSIPPKPEDPPGHGYWIYFRGCQDAKLNSGWHWMPLITTDDINLNVNLSK